MLLKSYTFEISCAFLSWAQQVVSLLFAALLPLKSRKLFPAEKSLVDLLEEQQSPEKKTRLFVALIAGSTSI